MSPTVALPVELRLADALGLASAPADMNAFGKNASLLQKKQQARKACKGQTVSIFDWDDTLLCTSWLRQMDLNEGVDGVLLKIAAHTKFLLEAALRLGHVYIVTNATTGWVESTAANFVPELMPVLTKIRIISARDKYGPLFPDDMKQWKVQAFRAIRRQLSSQVGAPPITNVVSLGDNEFEMLAARIMVEECEDPSPVLKTVRFQQHPTPKEHLKQVQKVAQSIERIVKSSNELTVVLQKSQTKSDQP